MKVFELFRLLTSRLEMIAATPKHLEAELKSLDRLASFLNAEIEPDWPPGEYDRAAQEFFLSHLMEGGAAVAGWYNWYALYRVKPQLPMIAIGAGGYFGPPDERGEVEIGFSVMPAWRCQGYAAEIAEALTVNAFSDGRVDKVRAHTNPENTVSCRVLEKCSFTNVGLDEESGCYRYEILRDSSSHNALVRQTEKKLVR